MIVIDESIERLRLLCEIIPPLLERITDSEFSFKPSPEKWSKKEILGHLIDSATNNHHRFVRIQYEPEPIISYDQNKWNSLNHYADLDRSKLIIFWTLYNKHLVHLLEFIPEENLRLNGRTGNGELIPLHFYITDYVNHLEHHLQQLVR